MKLDFNQVEPQGWAHNIYEQQIHTKREIQNLGERISFLTAKKFSKSEPLCEQKPLVIS